MGDSSPPLRLVFSPALLLLAPALTDSFPSQRAAERQGCPSCGRGAGSWGPSPRGRHCTLVPSERPHPGLDGSRTLALLPREPHNHPKADEDEKYKLHLQQNHEVCEPPSSTGLGALPRARPSWGVGRMSQGQGGDTLEAAGTTQCTLPGGGNIPGWVLRGGGALHKTWSHTGRSYGHGAVGALASSWAQRPTLGAGCAGSLLP